MFGNLTESKKLNDIIDNDEKYDLSFAILFYENSYYKHFSSKMMFPFGHLYFV